MYAEAYKHGSHKDDFRRMEPSERIDRCDRSRSSSGHRHHRTHGSKRSGSHHRHRRVHGAERIDRRSRSKTRSNNARRHRRSRGSDRHDRSRSSSGHRHHRTHGSKRSGSHHRHRRVHGSNRSNWRSRSSSRSNSVLRHRPTHGSNRHDRSQSSSRNLRSPRSRNYNRSNCSEISDEHSNARRRHLMKIISVAAGHDSMLQLPISTFTPTAQTTQDSRYDNTNINSVDSTRSQLNPYMGDDNPQYLSKILPNLTDYAYQVPSANHGIDPSGMDSQVRPVRSYGTDDQECNMQSSFPFISEMSRNGSATKTESHNEDITNFFYCKPRGMNRIASATDVLENLDAIRTEPTGAIVEKTNGQIGTAFSDINQEIQYFDGPKSSNEDSVTAGQDIGAYNTNCYVKLHHLQGVQSLANQVVKEEDAGKAQRHDGYERKLQQQNFMHKCTVKNNNPTWHCLSKEIECKICEVRSVNHWQLVDHYVKVHPYDEVFTSRVAADVAELLRDSKVLSNCERVRLKLKHRHRTEYKQFCYFCNVVLKLEKYQWINHIARHTGYFRYQCTHCSAKFHNKTDRHKCAEKCRVEIVSQPQFDARFEEVNVIAYLCDVCNYVRFDKTEIEMHLRSQHSVDVKNNFKEVFFLSFPGRKNNAGAGGKSNANQTSGIVPSPENFTKPILTGTPIKNNNPDWHTLNKKLGCQICAAGFRSSLVNHYVNVHPNSEVISSRVTPGVANFLRNSTKFHECERVLLKGHGAYKQFCYFCNESRCCRKEHWIDHIITHTGYFKYQCTDCLKKFLKSSNHMCEDKCNVKRVQQPQFEGVNLVAYLCDLCNYVRFNKTEIEMHLESEHQGNVKGKFKEIVFLTFPAGSSDSDVTHRSIKKEGISEESVATENVPKQELSSTIDGNFCTPSSGTTVLKVESSEDCASNALVAEYMAKVNAILEHDQKRKKPEKTDKQKIVEKAEYAHFSSITQPLIKIEKIDEASQVTAAEEMLSKSKQNC